MDEATVVDGVDHSGSDPRWTCSVCQEKWSQEEWTHEGAIDDEEVLGLVRARTGGQCKINHNQHFFIHNEHGYCEMVGHPVRSALDL